MYSEWQETVHNFLDKLRAFIHVIYIFKILTDFKVKIHFALKLLRNKI